METLPSYPTQQLMLLQQQRLDNNDGEDFSMSSFFSLQHPPADQLLLDHQRLLQSSDSRGRTVLTVLYLSVLGLCFVVPIFYYFRLHCEERHARRLREMEMIDFAALFATTTHNNNNNSNEEVIQSRAVRKKYREERRARILQLLQPVRVTLTKDHFPPQTSLAAAQGVKSTTERDEKNDDLEAPREESSQPPKPPPPPPGEYPLADDDDEGTSFIELPPPGLPSNSASDGLTTVTAASSSANATLPAETRLVPSVCAICLSHYQLGEDVVWSSNPACEHAFHFPCVERWLSKQRDGPLCPCCRREFVIDPFDLQEEEDDDDDTTTVHRPSESAIASSNSHRMQGGESATLIESGLLRNPSYSYRRPDVEMPSSASSSVRIPLPPPMVLEEDAVIVNIDNPSSDNDAPNISRTEPLSTVSAGTTTATTTSSQAVTTNQTSSASEQGAQRLEVGSNQEPH